jgi:hypothetical protein
MARSSSTTNNTERRIPQSMQEPVQPQGETKLVSARFENTEEGVCPVCHEPMKPTSANGVDSLVCLAHRIVMPVRDNTNV